MTITTEIAHAPEIVFDAFSGFARCDRWVKYKERLTGSSSQPAESARGFWRTTSPDRGLPIEELLFGFSFGLMWTGIYEHFSWSRGVAELSLPGVRGGVRKRPSKNS